MLDAPIEEQTPQIVPRSIAGGLRLSTLKQVRAIGRDIDWRPIKLDVLDCCDRHLADAFSHTNYADGIPRAAKRSRKLDKTVLRSQAPDLPALRPRRQRRELVLERAV